jgi:putative transposase
VRLSELVNSLKGVSSRRLKQEFPAIKVFWSVRKSRG